MAVALVRGIRAPLGTLSSCCGGVLCLRCFYLLKLLKPHYFLTLSLIRFIFCMLIHIGPKFCAVPSHPPRSGEGQGHGLRIIKVFRISLLLKQMIDLVPIWYHDRYWSKVFISTINTHDRDLVVEVTDRI